MHRPQVYNLMSFDKYTCASNGLIKIQKIAITQKISPWFFLVNHPPSTLPEVTTIISFFFKPFIYLLFFGHAVPHVGLSSLTRDRTCIPCIGGWSLSHRATREAPDAVFLDSAICYYSLPAVWLQMCTSLPHTQSSLKTPNVSSDYGIGSETQDPAI